MSFIFILFPFILYISTFFVLRLTYKKVLNNAQIVLFGDSQTQYVENGYLVNIPEKPFVDSVFDYDTKSWTNPSADIRWQFIRLKRNNLLSTCDWTQSIDSPLSSEKKNEWATYRQALRDVTNQADPFNLVWPTQPE
jgi:hypothetical protein